jgi:hypothetical protein
VANKDYIERLKQVIFHLHKASPIWVESVPVHEVFRGETVWKGEVEVFDLTGHPKAKRAYGWSHPEGNAPPDVVLCSCVPEYVIVALALIAAAKLIAHTVICNFFILKLSVGCNCKLCG